MKKQDERFIKKERPWDWWFVFDKKQEYIEDNKIPVADVDNLIAMSEDQVIDLLNKLYNENMELKKENERLKKVNKGQELEITRLHNLADAMSGALRELGVYDVYDNEKIDEIKNIIGEYI